MSLTPPLDDKGCNPFLTPPLDVEHLVTSYAPSSVKGCEDFTCLWKNCFRTFNDPELLYNHLANDHVGRKSTGNLCLVCHWDGCGNSSKKRDHITSHLRVHVSSKPHSCERCNKAFKRPQDLKKHEKTHTSQHQRKIYDGKLTKIKNQPLTPPQLLPDDSPGDSTRSSPLLPCSPNSVASGSPVYNIYPIPHQNVSQFSDGAILESSIFEAEADYVKLKPSQKRSMEVFEGFYQDVKKQRIGPKYNDDLIGKLEGFSSALDDINIDQASFPPSLRKMEDLNVLEDFLAQALKEVESYSVPLYASTNIGYNWENLTDSGDPCNFPDSIGSISGVYPTSYDGYVPSPSPLGSNVGVECNYAPQIDNFIESDHTVEPVRHTYALYQHSQRSVKGPSVSTSNISNSTNSHETETEESVDDISSKMSALDIKDNNKPGIEASKQKKYYEVLREKHISLINSIRKKVADFSRRLDESSVKPDDRDRGEDAVQPNASSNFSKNSLPTQVISEGDKLNLEVESLVVVE